MSDNLQTTKHPCCGALIGMQHMENCPERWEISAGQGYNKMRGELMTDNTGTTSITPEQEAQVFDALQFTDTTAPWIVALLRNYGVKASDLRPKFDSNLRCMLSNCYLEHQHGKKAVNVKA